MTKVFEGREQSEELKKNLKNEIIQYSKLSIFSPI
jgi:hypothetical protein